MNLVLYLPIILLGLLLLLNLFYHYWFWIRLLLYKDKQSAFNRQELPVSVIIAARNEAANLTRHLPAFMEQDYSDFEVVVVNDCSYDESEDILKELQTRYPRLKVVTIAEQAKYPTGKKFALTLGIKAAEHNVLLFSDADCYPASRQWIRQMQKQYIDKTEIVLGFGGYAREKTLLNLFIQYDTILTALQYLSHTLAGRAYMGVGRNLSYYRSLFFFHKGFVSHIKHLSGDDDLFVNQASTGSNTRINIEPEAYTISVPKKSWGAWNRQKNRHFSTGKFYRTADKMWLSMATFMHIMLFPALISAIYTYWNSPVWLYISVGVFTFTLFHRWLFLGLAGRKFGDARFVWALPLIDMLHPLLQLGWGLRGTFSKNKW